jgi:hypothetical protein
MKRLPCFTFGMRDRFGQEGEAQLFAVMEAKTRGADLFPVWNESNREHTIVGTKPEELRTHRGIVGKRVRGNLLQDYIEPLFL